VKNSRNKNKIDGKKGIIKKLKILLIEIFRLITSLLGHGTLIDVYNVPIDLQ
jgi:hypothetical protein